MSFQEKFNEAVAEWLRERYNFNSKEVAQVTGVSQKVESGGYCDTCWYEEISVEIYYLSAEGGFDSYTYYGNMADFMKELTDEATH